MSVGFGFSFGDFVEGIRLITDIVAALKDSTGASAEYRDLMTQLDGLEKALIAVKTSNLQELSREYFETADQAVRDCQACITNFLTKVAKYQDLSFGHRTMKEQFLAGHIPLRDQILRIKWAKCHKEDVSNLRSKLAGQVAVLNLLLNVIQISRSTTANKETNSQLNDQRKLIEDVHDRLDRSDSNVEQLLAKIELLVISPPSYEPPAVPFSFEVRPLRLIGAPIAPDYIERKEMMHSIEEACLSVPVGLQTRVVLQGMGGIGKSQLARSYATGHQNNYSAIFWLNAKTEQSLRRGIALIAEQIPLPDVLDAGRCLRSGEAGTDAAVAAVISWLCLKDNTDWLLVFDNLDRQISGEHQEDEFDATLGSSNAGFDAYKYIPDVSHGCLLITSRLSFLSRAFGATDIRVAEMSPHEGIRLLCKASHKNPEEPGIAPLVQRLGAHPLAVSQAGRLMYEMQMSPSKYLQQYDVRFKALLKTRPEAREYHNGSISATLGLSYDQLKERNASAAALLMLCSYFDNSNIYYELFQAFAKAREGLLFIPDDFPEDPQLLWIPGLSHTWLTEICENEDTYLSCVKSLHELSFVRHNDRSDSVSFHPLVHEWALHYCDTANMNRILSTTCNLLAAMVPQSDPEVLGLAHSQIQPHVDRFYSLLPSDLSSISASTSSILAIAKYYDVQGPTERASFLRNEAYTNALSKYGAEHRCTLEAGYQIAVAKLDSGDFEGALNDIKEKEVSYCKIDWDPRFNRRENEALARTTLMSFFAMCYRELNKLEEARHILTTLKELLSELADTSIVTAVSIVYFLMKIVVNIADDEYNEEEQEGVENSTESLEHLLKMIEDTNIWPPSLGSRVSTSAAVLFVLATKCNWSGDTVKGQAYLQKALDLYEQLNGPSAPETLAVARELAESGALPSVPLIMRDERWRIAIIASLGRTPAGEDVSVVPLSSLLGSRKPALAALSHIRWVETLTIVRKAVKDRPKA
ncbi:hypothetical protein MMC11_008064 [Xylographa trunciseda]|nr:hypothetical protein [Xylographa trunciseda]